MHHYFGTKDKLFLAAMDAPIDPGELIPQALAGPREEAGERLVRLVLSVWDSPAGSAAVADVPVGGEQRVDGAAAARVRGHPDPAAGGERADRRPGRGAVALGRLVATQMAGLMVARYVLKLEPLASADAETLVAAIGPTVQRFLADPMPEVFKDPPGQSVGA